MKRLFLLLLFLMVAVRAEGADYTADANCVQSFILDDGTQDTTDRTGSNDLTLANGTWGGSNVGYVFDSDATGTFTPALTSWMTSNWTIAIKYTPSQTSGHVIYNTYQAADTNRRILIQSNPYSANGRVDIVKGREYSGSAEEHVGGTGGETATRWAFLTWDNSTNTQKIYINTSDVTEIIGAAGPYGSMAMDTGILGSASTHVIFQVGVFTRILNSTELSDIVTNGLGYSSGGTTTATKIIQGG